MSLMLCWLNWRIWLASPPTLELRLLGTLWVCQRLAPFVSYTWTTHALTEPLHGLCHPGLINCAPLGHDLDAFLVCVEHFFSRHEVAITRLSSVPASFCAVPEPGIGHKGSPRDTG